MKQIPDSDFYRGKIRPKLTDDEWAIIVYECIRASMVNLNEKKNREYIDNGFTLILVRAIMMDTEKAFKVSIHGGTIEWIPKSQIMNPVSFKPGNEYVAMFVSKWIASEKGLK